MPKGRVESVPGREGTKITGRGRVKPKMRVVKEKSHSETEPYLETNRSKHTKFQIYPGCEVWKKLHTGTCGDTQPRSSREEGPKPPTESTGTTRTDTQRTKPPNTLSSGQYKSDEGGWVCGTSEH